MQVTPLTPAVTITLPATPQSIPKKPITFSKPAEGLAPTPMVSPTSVDLLKVSSYDQYHFVQITNFSIRLAAANADHASICNTPLSNCSHSFYFHPLFYDTLRYAWEWNVSCL
jgi:hypothetical protein